MEISQNFVAFSEYMNFNTVNLPQFNKALDRNCFLVYHETLFVVIPIKKERAVDIEILMEPACPNQSAQTKNDCSAISS